MENTELQAGQIVFLANGREAKVVGQVSDMVIVEPGYIREIDEPGYIHEMEDETFYGKPIAVPRSYIFIKAPTEKIDVQITSLEQKLVAMRAEHQQLTNEISAAKADRSTMLADIQAIPALTRIHDFISGKITHIVMDDYQPSIKTLEEALKKDDRYDKGYKLMTLFGKDPKNFSFRVNQYSDGSGTYTIAHPCFSYEEAKEKLTEILQEKAASYLEKNQPHNLGGVIQAASKASILMPPEVVQAWEAFQLQKATSHRDHIAGKLAEAEKELARYQAPAAQ